MGRVCRRRKLVQTNKKTIVSMFVFAFLAIALGVVLSMISIPNVWVLGIAICVFGILYLPIAFVIDRFIIK